MPELTQEQINKISAAVMEQVRDDKDNNSLPENDPLAKEKIHAMVLEQLKLINEQNKGRGSDGFNENTDGQYLTAEEKLKEEFKEVDAMPDQVRKEYRELKMLESREALAMSDGNDLSERIENFKSLNDEAYLITTMLHGANRKVGGGKSIYQVYGDTRVRDKINGALNKDADLRKALAVATAGSGAEWIPTGFSSSVLTTIELQMKVASLFATIAMPTNPYTLPIQTANAEGYLIPENVSDEGTKIKASTPSTGNASFTARKLAGRVLFSEEINEDSIVAVRAFTVAELSKAIARAHETALVNGDRTGAAGVASAHQDNAGTALFTSNYDPRLAFDGLRYIVLNQADTSTVAWGNAALADATMGALRLLMGKHGVFPSDLTWISSVDTYLHAIYQLANIQTLDKYGPQATVLSGEVMKYQGIPWIMSEYLFSNLDTTGLYTGTNEDRAMLLLVYRPGFLNGTRGGVTLASEMDIETDQIKLVAKRRVDFVDPYDATATGNVQVVGGINISTA